MLRELTNGERTLLELLQRLMVQDIIITEDVLYGVIDQLNVKNDLLNVHLVPTIQTLCDPMVQEAGSVHHSYTEMSNGVLARSTPPLPSAARGQLPKIPLAKACQPGLLYLWQGPAHRPFADGKAAKRAEGRPNGANIDPK